MKTKYLALLGVVAFVPTLVWAAPDPNPDSNANVVYLRTNCNVGTSPLKNCFEGMSTLTGWIANTRQPTAAAPLVVEIGPGTFSAFGCQNGGYTTLRGSGRQNTIITNGQVYGDAFEASNCTQLDISDLSIVGTTNALHTMDWLGTGTSTWSNVNIIGNSYGWFDNGGTHFWFGCRFLNNAGYGVSRAYETAGVSWFFGSEIEADSPNGAGEVEALGVLTGGEAHVYGGVLRAVVSGGNGGNTLSSDSGIKAVNANGAGSMVHIHGTGIDVISGPGNQIAALMAGTGAMIHANGAAYNLSTGTGGTVYRILNNGGDVRAPYQWEEGPTPPQIQSANGSDTTVLTNTTDGQPHLLIYSTSCAGGWYDTAIRACH
ncbi:MAG: hypothetical protein ACYC9J_14325 [Sulfuricaulis sp.]